MKWDFFASQQASNLMEQADRIERNFLQIAAGHHRALNSPAAASAPPVNVVETDQACWIMTALPGADADRIDIPPAGRRTDYRGHAAVANLLRARRTQNMEDAAETI
ncbi:MAG: hypothetical protein ACXW5W_14180 [Candidatus Binatia bacterium]